MLEIIIIFFSPWCGPILNIRRHIDNPKICKLHTIVCFSYSSLLSYPVTKEVQNMIFMYTVSTLA
jgi:hypothetical protein